MIVLKIFGLACLIVLGIVATGLTQMHAGSPEMIATVAGFLTVGLAAMMAVAVVVGRLGSAVIRLTMRDSE